MLLLNRYDHLPSLHPGSGENENDVFRYLVEGAAASTGHEFFRNLAEGLSSALGTLGAWVALYRRETRELQAIAMKMGDEWWDGMLYAVDGIPSRCGTRDRFGSSKSSRPGPARNCGA